MKLFVARHGQTVWNSLDKISGITDVDLTEQGREQARELARQMEEKNIDIIQKRIRLLINSLSNCGLNSRQTNNEDLRIILDNFLNGGRTTNFGTVMAA